MKTPRLLFTAAALLLGSFAPASQAQVMETVFSDSLGQYPRGGLVQNSDGDFYGTTSQGGVSGRGTVFKISAGGAHKVLFSFNGTNGRNPYGWLVKGSDGDFYGTTHFGGTLDRGTVFKVSADGTHTLLFSFLGANGRNPDAGLVQGSDGDFYGTTTQGGTSHLGTVFKITAAGVQTLLHSFDGTSGSTPYAGLVQGSDGDFYGTTHGGGANSLGTIYKITAAGTHTVLHDFDGSNGSNPFAGLVQGSDGDFYGTTQKGGTSDLGTVFKITAAGTHTRLYSFSTSGHGPVAGLVQGNDGHFYGATNLGGVGGFGTVYQITAAGTHTLLHSFDSTNGRIANAGLIQASDGDFYSTTGLGGVVDVGTIYKITASGTHTLLRSLDYFNGNLPNEGLVEGSDGDFYGTTYSGGISGNGTVFKVTAAGTRTVLHRFNSTDGRAPQGKLVRGSDGDFYGTTQLGGASNLGTVFKITAGGTHTLLHSFNGSNGSTPYGGLVQGSDGDFYGTTYNGGASSAGTVFKITASGTHTRLYSFNASGRNPYAGLVQGSDGDFYGTTYLGGASSAGTVFKITSDGTHTLLYSFNASGRNPYAALVEGADGNFYGTTYNGGASNHGTVFKISPGGTHTLLHSFNDSNGSYPYTGLVQGRDGHFYGATYDGGAGGNGTVFKITGGGTHTVLHEFDGTQGRSPHGTPIFASDGHLYGTAYSMSVWRMPSVVTGLGVSGNSRPIINGDPTPNTADHTAFGTLVANGGSIVRTFTLANLGPAELTLTGTPRVQLSGSLAFSVSTQPASATLAGDGGTQTFQITYAPTEAGLHSAVVSIASDATDGSPLTFTVAGVATEPIALALSSALYTSGGGSTLQVTVERTGSTAPVAVTLATRDGSASVVPPFAAAVAGTDYEALSTQVAFAEGEFSRQVTLNLLPRTGTLPNRRFEVELSSPTGGAALGAISSAEVRLLANDATAPSLSVRFPTATATLVTQVAPLVIKGTAGDSLGLERVEVDYGGMTYQATLGAATLPTSVPWSFELTPPGNGTVSLEIRAYNLSGIATTVTRSFNFIRRYPVEVTRQVPDGVSPPELAGTVRLSSSKGDFSALMPTKGALTQTGAVAPLAQVTLTPRAAAGYAFSHWQGLPSGHSLKGRVASFQMPEEDVTGITAVFVNNPYLDLGTRPVFYGLIQNRFGFASNNATNGSLTAALVTGTGNFSGKVFLNGQTTSFTGLALGDGDVWFRAPDKSLHRELAVGDAQLTGYFESGNFHMFVSNGSDLMGGAAQPAEYSKTNLVPADLLNRAAVSGGSLDQGFYTVALPAKEQSTDKPLTDYPQGSGYASLTLKNNGTLRLAGVLADGTRFTAASALVAEGESPVHAQLPTPATTTREKGGSLLGTLSFDPNQDDSDVSGYDLLWFRPAVTEQSGTTTAAKATQVYTEGWEDGIEVDLIGAFYDKTATAEATLGFSAGNAGVLSFSEGKLATPVEVSNFSLTGNTATKSPTTDRSFSLSFTQSAGLMRGTFTPGWTSTKLPAFQGVLLGKGANRGGWGFFLSNQTGDLDPESGAVTLDQP